MDEHIIKVHISENKEQTVGSFVIGGYVGELVRCRDCKYFGNKVRVGDTFVCNKHGIYVPKDGFCSEGKTK